MNFSRPVSVAEAVAPGIATPVKTQTRSHALANVMFVVDASTFGGVEVHTIGLIRRLAQAGVAVQLISCRNREYDERLADEVRNGAVRIVHTDLSIRDGGMTAWGAWRNLLRDMPRGVCVLPKPWHPLGSLALHWQLRRHADRFFVIEHLEAEPLSFGYLRNPLNLLRRRTWILLYRLLDRRLSAQLATRVVAVSTVVEQRLLTDWRYPPARIVTIRNGISWRNFTRRADACVALRAAHSIRGNALVFGMLARLSHDKGIDIALGALHLLVQEDPHTRAMLVVAGQGPKQAELQAQVSRLGLDAHVRFLGFVADTRALVSAFDAILFSSRREGLPLGLLEGMAAGCVPIVTRVSGMPEVVTGPEVGWVVPPEDPQRLATAMQEVLRLDARHLQQFRDRAVARVRESFDADVSYQRLIDLLGASSNA